MTGMGLTPLAFRRKCAEYIGTLSAARRAAAADYFGGTITPGKSFLPSFLGRWPELRLYRVGTLEISRAINSRPEVVARWFAALSLLYRHERITVGQQIWNMDETAVKARDIILHAWETIIGGKGLLKPEVVVPDVGSGAEGCTAAFTISAVGDTAPPFLVVGGGKEGHAFFRATPAAGSSATSIPLSSRLQDGATVVRRTPGGGFNRAFGDLSWPALTPAWRRGAPSTSLTRWTASAWRLMQRSRGMLWCRCSSGSACGPWTPARCQCTKLTRVPIPRRMTLIFLP